MSGASIMVADHKVVLTRAEHGGKDQTTPAAKHADVKSSSMSKPKFTRIRVPLSVDVEIDRWPLCIVWTPLPIITYFCPIIGHTGVADTQGIIYDFSDDFKVTRDNFSFGTPTKYYQFHASRMPLGLRAWDKAIKETSDYYARTRHSLFFNNCHQYIATVLNKVHYEDRSDWSQTEVWSMITFKSNYVGWMGFVRQWWPFAAIMTATIIVLVALIT